MANLTNKVNFRNIYSRNNLAYLMRLRTKSILTPLPKNIRLGWKLHLVTTKGAYYTYSVLIIYYQYCIVPYIPSCIYTWGRINNTSYLSQLTYWPNKLECQISLGWICLSGTNTLAYWTHSLLMKKLKCCEFCP